VPDLRTPALQRALELPGAVCEHPFGEGVDVLKVAGKVFVILSPGPPPRITLKVDPELGRALVDGEPAITPGHHMNKRHWITIDPAGEIDPDLAIGLVEDAYDLVAPRTRSRPGQNA
jgi:predicted DNA-binding protein (MmcQ/YjbR family)